jgi:hypothetical protein
MLYTIKSKKNTVKIESDTLNNALNAWVYNNIFSNNNEKIKDIVNIKMKMEA